MAPHGRANFSVTTNQSLPWWRCFKAQGLNVWLAQGCKCGPSICQKETVCCEALTVALWKLCWIYGNIFLIYSYLLLLLSCVRLPWHLDLASVPVLASGVATLTEHCVPMHAGLHFNCLQLQVQMLFEAHHSGSRLGWMKLQMQKQASVRFLLHHHVLSC